MFRPKVNVSVTQFKQLLDPDQFLKRRQVLSPGRINLALCFCADKTSLNNRQIRLESFVA
jgi:hypothetical protein